jgi:hypothetical protein
LANHAYFEELCALAPLGELTPAQLGELDEHIVHCDACSQATIDYNRLFQQVVPQVTRADEKFIESRRTDIRAAVIQSVGAIELERDYPSIATKEKRLILPSFLPGLLERRFAYSLLGGFATVTVAGTAFWLGGHLQRQPPPSKASAAASVSVSLPRPQQAAPAPKLVPAPVVPAAEAEQTKAALDKEIQRNSELAGKLSLEDGKLNEALAAEDALRAQVDQQTQALTATRADLDAKTIALTQARSASSSDTRTIAALETQVHDLNEKMSAETASLDRDHDLLSHGREIRDIIGARNLHIIDVYDTSTEGTTRKPFARAFYTEGKSLVYYAYDLPQRWTEEGKFSYVAWGQSNGSKANIRKIGILFHDDQTQRRWSLNFADPNVLREIDSVFITLERDEEPLAQPKGKRMLTAYLGTAPNHP